MTAIAWAIFIYTVVRDKSLETASEGAKNLAYGLCSFGLLCIIVLTIKDIFK